MTADTRLIEFIASEKKAGKSNDEIKASLVSIGWEEKDIDEAFSKVNPKVKESGRKSDMVQDKKIEIEKVEKTGDLKKSHKKIYISGIVIVLAILAVTTVYLYYMTNIFGTSTGELLDRCGDGFCSGGENYDICAQDCPKAFEPGNGNEPSGPVTISISPATKTVSNGETFTIEALISGATDVFGFQFNVEYNPAILEFQTTSLGGFLSRSGQDNTFCVDYTASSGLVKNIACTRLGGGPVQGSGVLQTVTFKAISAGTSAITFSNLKVANSKAQEVQSTGVNGEVQVT